MVFMKRIEFINLPFAISFLLTLLFLGCCKQYVSSNDVIGEAEENKEARIAPLFIHGPGHGELGRWSFTPPIFFKEEKARQIIMEEFNEVGITIDITDLFIDEMNEENSNGLTGNAKWILDGYCTEFTIGFEFVSKEDYFDLVKPHKGFSFREDYYIIGAAEKVRSEFMAYGKITLGVFYDPLVPVDMYLHWAKENPEKIKDLAKEYTTTKLRLQVRDFIIWLEEEGIIIHTN